jgi:hypothetical protein
VCAAASAPHVKLQLANTVEQEEECTQKSQHKSGTKTMGNYWYQIFYRKSVSDAKQYLKQKLGHLKQKVAKRILVIIGERCQPQRALIMQKLQTAPNTQRTKVTSFHWPKQRAQLHPVPRYHSWQRRWQLLPPPPPPPLLTILFFGCVRPYRGCLLQNNVNTQSTFAG